MSIPICINVADMVDSNDVEGRTFRQVNASKTHKIPVGTLVEVSDSKERLYVKNHTRDCDQTPLYSIGMLLDQGFDRNVYGYNTWNHGYTEDDLTVVS